MLGESRSINLSNELAYDENDTVEPIPYLEEEENQRKDYAMHDNLTTEMATYSPADFENGLSVSTQRDFRIDAIKCEFVSLTCISS